MTEPDEALLWAREDYASLWTQYNPDLSERILKGFWDDSEYVFRRAARHRAAASAERIKELEARVAELALFVKRIAHRWVPKRMTLGLLREICRAESIHAAALLKEPDQ